MLEKFFDYYFDNREQYDPELKTQEYPGLSLPQLGGQGQHPVDWLFDIDSPIKMDKQLFNQFLHWTH